MYIRGGSHILWYRKQRTGDAYCSGDGKAVILDILCVCMVSKIERYVVKTKTPA
jgi:hypothetical protein